MGDELYESFIVHMDSTEFDFETELLSNINELRGSLDSVADSTIYLPMIEEMTQLAENEKAGLFEHERKEIQDRLVIELASALGGSAGRTQASLGIDPDIVKAIEILQNPELYSSVLAGTFAIADPETDGEQ
ncbi:MAG TPA: hypothetical protein ENH10_06005 [Bacteroidetes bacterium]|nr:hypothetical protein [Bacteroidota bacterium]HEX04698.1 hypothetical protein [Bacteroidota bacterium]